MRQGSLGAAAWAQGQGAPATGGVGMQAAGGAGSELGQQQAVAGAPRMVSGRIGSLAMRRKLHGIGRQQQQTQHDGTGSRQEGEEGGCSGLASMLGILSSGPAADLTPSQHITSKDGGDLGAPGPTVGSAAAAEGPAMLSPLGAGDVAAAAAAAGTVAAPKAAAASTSQLAPPPAILRLPTESESHPLAGMFSPAKLIMGPPSYTPIKAVQARAMAGTGTTPSRSHKSLPRSSAAGAGAGSVPGLLPVSGFPVGTPGRVRGTPGRGQGTPGRGSLAVMSPGLLRQGARAVAREVRWCCCGGGGAA